MQRSRRPADLRPHVRDNRPGLRRVSEPGPWRSCVVRGRSRAQDCTANDHLMYFLTRRRGRHSTKCGGRSDAERLRLTPTQSRQREAIGVWRPTKHVSILRDAGAVPVVPDRVPPSEAASRPMRRETPEWTPSSRRQGVPNRTNTTP
jgi:hypothetical protein